MSEAKSRPWRTLVAEGKRLVQQGEGARWGIADLALEVAPMKQRGGSTYDKKPYERLEKYAAAIGDISYKTLLSYRWTASRWPADKRNLNVSMSTHHILASEADRFELIKTVTTSREARKITQRPARVDKRNERRTTADQVHAIRLMLRDAEVARALCEDDEVAKVLRQYLTDTNTIAQRPQTKRRKFWPSSLVPVGA